MADPFPPEEFDDWAAGYDQSVLQTQSFPFTGYQHALDKVFELATPEPEMCILDLGIGTGNLAIPFARLGCEVWGTDFSAAMLEKARHKLPQAHLLQSDLRQDWPAELNRRFDRIVSGYVFHHFELPKKVEIIQKLVQDHLVPGGRLLIADIAFHNQAALEAEKVSVGDAWDDEFYWLADETISTLTQAGLQADFFEISSCAGVFAVTGT